MWDNILGLGLGCNNGWRCHLPLSLIYNGKVQLEIECGAEIYNTYSSNLSRVLASSSSYMYVIKKFLGLGHVDV